MHDLQRALQNKVYKKKFAMNVLYLLTKTKYGHVDLDKGRRHNEDVLVDHTHLDKQRMKSYEDYESTIVYNLKKICNIVL